MADSPTADSGTTGTPPPRGTPATGVLDSEVIALLSRFAPPTSFLHRYCWYGAQATDSPLVYHLASGLALLAAVASPAYGLIAGMMAPVWANLYVLALGPSRCGKGLATGMGQRILTEAAGRVLMVDPTRQVVGNPPSTEEALFRNLQGQPTQLIFYHEYSNLLAATEAGSYRASIRDAYTELFDGTPQGRQYSKAKFECATPRVSILGGATPAHLEAHTVMTDWQGGFMSRHIVLYGTRESRANSGTEHQINLGWEQELARALVDLAVRTNITPCAGFTPGAKAEWNRWKTALGQYGASADPRVAGPILGADIHALKIMALAGLDWGGAQGSDPWWVTPEIVRFATAVAEYHVRAMDGIADMIPVNYTQRDRNLVRYILRQIEADHIARSESPWVSTVALKRKTPSLAAKDLKAGLTYWRECNCITETTQGTDTFLRFVDPDEAPAYDPVLAAMATAPDSGLVAFAAPKLTLVPTDNSVPTPDAVGVR